jgi:hypothetical protein
MFYDLFLLLNQFVLVKDLLEFVFGCCEINLVRQKEVFAVELAELFVDLGFV